MIVKDNMLKVLNDHRELLKAGNDTSVYTLDGLTDAQLALVETFVSSFDGPVFHADSPYELKQETPQ